MLPAANRLRTAADFRETTRTGVKSARGSVVVYLRPGADAAAPRVGVVTSKAIGGSVVRHRAARRIRAGVAPLLSEVPAGSRIVVRALPGADRDRGLLADLTACLKRVVERA